MIEKELEARVRQLAEELGGPNALVEAVRIINAGRDIGLAKAIAATGSAQKLAKKLGVAPQTIYNWRRIPAERVIDIEAVTGVARKELRPDLYEGYDMK
jgi:hypothetical protein